MSKDILGSLMRVVSTVPKDRLGSVLDLARKLAGPEGARWLTELKKFLRKEACWGVKVFRTLFVDGNKTLDDMIADGKYNEVGGGCITTNQLAIMCEGTWEFDLYCPGRAISFWAAIKAVKSKDKENPWMPADVVHLLGFGQQYPMEQCKDPVVALIQTSNGCVDSNMLDLYYDRRKRILELRRWDNGYGDYCRILIVRRVIKKS